MLVVGALYWSVEWWATCRLVEDLTETARRFVRDALAEPS